MNSGRNSPKSKAKQGKARQGFKALRVEQQTGQQQAQLSQPACFLPALRMVHDAGTLEPAGICDLPAMGQQQASKQAIKRYREDRCQILFQRHSVKREASTSFLLFELEFIFGLAGTAKVNGSSPPRRERKRKRKFRTPLLHGAKSLSFRVKRCAGKGLAIGGRGEREDGRRSRRNTRSRMTHAVSGRTARFSSV